MRRRRRRFATLSWFAPEWCRIRIVGQSGVAWRGGGGVARIFEIYASK